MKLRTLALAGVALAALTAPASAGTGWYLGVAAGVSNLDPVRYQKATPALSVTAAHDSNAVFAGAIGYKFGGFVRLENEISYSSHDISSSTGASGHTEIRTTMINIIADIPIYNDWTFSAGGGIGAGAMNTNVTVVGLPGATTYTVVNGDKTGLAWQAIAGVSVPLSPQVDFFVDYRYRNLELNQNYASSYVLFNPIQIRGTHEQNIMAGVRWFIE